MERGWGSGVTVVLANGVGLVMCRAFGTSAHELKRIEDSALEEPREPRTKVSVRLDSDRFKCQAEEVGPVPLRKWAAW